MGRGRVQLKRIENKINRQVTFSKRRMGLLKKAHEISVLCEVEVALVIFSAKGKLYEYSTNSSMSKILERYERHSFAERELAIAGPDLERNWCHEYGKLKAKIEALQMNLRHFMGEDLDSLSMRELQQLEQQLDAALRHVRSRKNQVLLDSIADLQMKEKALQEENRILEKKVQEKEKALLQTHESSVPLLLSSPLPVLNMGSYPNTARLGPAANEGGITRPGATAASAARGNSLVPTWMLRPANGGGLN